MKDLGLFDFNTEEVEMLNHKDGEEEGNIHFPLDSWKTLALIQNLKMLRELPEWRR